MYTTLMITMLLSMAKSDKICVGIATGNGTFAVQTITKGIQLVTAVHEISKEPAKAPFGAPKGMRGGPRLCSSCSSVCTDLDVALQSPMCLTPSILADFSVVHEPRPTTSQCYPLMHSHSNIRQLANRLKEFGDVRSMPGPAVDTSTLPGGPYTIGFKSSSCKDPSGVNSFWGTVDWMTNNVKTGVELLPLEMTNICGVGETMIFVWGFHADIPTTMTTLYGVSSSQEFHTEKGGVKRGFIAQTGNFPALTESDPSTQSGRMILNYEVLSPGEVMTIRFQRGLLPPKSYWCAKRPIPTIKGPRTVDPTATGDCLHEFYGLMNKSSPFYHGTRGPSVGNCPTWVNKPLKMINGTRGRTSTVIQRGFFGAIAGFLEGGFEGMTAGWHGYSSTGNHGTAVAADLTSTQKAVKSITENMNRLSETINSSFSKVNSALGQLHEEILMVDSKLNDLRADTFAAQIEMAVLLANEGIIDSEDSHLIELERELRAMLGPSAVDNGDGCFTVSHSCNKTCLDSITTKSYTPITYGMPTFSTPVVTGVKTEGLNTNDILLYYAVAASSAVLAMGMGGLVAYLASTGSLRCTVCL